MATLISEQTPIAKKDYECMASLFLDGVGRPDFFDCISDYRAYIKARNNGFKVRKGEKYIRQFCRDSGGDTYTFIAIPEIHEICLKYDLYLD